MTSSSNSDLIQGLKQGMLLGAAVALLALPPRAPSPPGSAGGSELASASTSSPGSSKAPLAAALQADFAGQAASPEARRVAQWVVGTADNGARPFVIVDKVGARVFVFEPHGRLTGATPVLLGYAAGDDTVPGIGDRPLSQVRPEERTTPAGRFVAEPGRNASNEEVLWVDYQAAVSMHRVRLTNPKEHRLERLASPVPSDHRISYGCINMPKDFFEQVLWPAVHRTRPIVYVLPEVKPLNAVFPNVV